MHKQITHIVIIVVIEIANLGRYIDLDGNLKFTVLTVSAVLNKSYPFQDSKAKKEATLGSNLKLFGRAVFHIWLPRKDMDSKPCVEVTTGSTVCRNYLDGRGYYFLL